MRTADFHVHDAGSVSAKRNQMDGNRSSSSVEFAGDRGMAARLLCVVVGAEEKEPQSGASGERKPVVRIDVAVTGWQLDIDGLSAMLAAPVPRSAS